MVAFGREAHVVVVGGGISGAFALYFLSTLGVDATLVERDELGSQASGKNPGGLNPLHGPGIPGAMEDFAQCCFRLHAEVWEPVRSLSAVDFTPRFAPRIHLALEELDVEQLEEAKALHDGATGFSATWMDTKDVLSVEPRLSAAIIRGLWTEGNAKVDARAYTRAVAEGAIRNGARVIRGEVTGLARRSSRVTAVRLDSGPIGCDGVVIATGPWCSGPESWLKVPIPVESIRGEMVRVEVSLGLSADVAWRDVGIYGAQTDRSVLLGGTEARTGYDQTASAEGRASLLARAARVMPGLDPVAVIEQTVGLRPVTPDGYPIIGLAPGTENVCLALGGGRKGMLYGVGMGMAAAELLALGTTRLPIDPCSPVRFANDLAADGE